jgi:hypothetical protein
MRFSIAITSLLAGALALPAQEVTLKGAIAIPANTTESSSVTPRWSWDGQPPVRVNKHVLPIILSAKALFFHPRFHSELRNDVANIRSSL